MKHIRTIFQFESEKAIKISFSEKLFLRHHTLQSHAGHACITIFKNANKHLDKIIEHVRAVISEHLIANLIGKFDSLDVVIELNKLLIAPLTCVLYRITAIHRSEICFIRYLIIFDVELPVIVWNIDYVPSAVISCGVI